MPGRILRVAGCLLLASAALAQSDWIAVPAQIQEYKLTQQPAPAYPKVAKQARIQGNVRLYVLIAKDGAVERIRLISGHPFLVQAAMDAVKQWQYRPTYRGGVPVRVVSTVDVHFTLVGSTLSDAPQKPTRV
jgi:protein TonB